MLLTPVAQLLVLTLTIETGGSVERGVTNFSCSEGVAGGVSNWSLEPELSSSQLSGSS